MFTVIIKLRSGTVERATFGYVDDAISYWKHAVLMDGLPAILVRHSDSFLLRATGAVDVIASIISSYKIQSQPTI